MTPARATPPGTHEELCSKNSPLNGNMPATAHRLERRRAWYVENVERVNARRRQLYAEGYRETVLQAQKEEVLQCLICARWFRTKYLPQHILCKHPLSPATDPEREGGEEDVESAQAAASVQID